MIRQCWIQFALLATSFCVSAASAATITISGSITQSTQDGTGPAVNNPSLNNIQDGQAYLITAIFPGPVTAPGTYAPVESDVQPAGRFGPRNEFRFHQPDDHCKWRFR